MSTLAGITLDTGALIALEGGKGQLSRRMKCVHEIGERVTVSSSLEISSSHPTLGPPLAVPPT